ncbi:MAG: TolC family protein, partial [Burkholderiaceae bacterium]
MRPRRAGTMASAGLALLASLALLTTTGLVGCASQGVPYQRPALELPAQWQTPTEAAPAPASAAVTDDWWSAFGSDELNRLVGAALAGNLELSAAQHRIEQVRALADASRASLQ